MSEAGVVEQTTTTSASALPDATSEQPETKPLGKLEAMTKAERLAWRLKAGQSSAPPEKAPDATPAEPAETDGDDTDTTIAPESAGKPRHDMKARLSQLAEQRRTAEARAERAEKMASDLAAKITAPPTTEAAPVESPDPTEPKLEDFLDKSDPIAAHAKAMALWAVDQFKQELAQKQTEQQITSTISNIRKAGETKYPDWGERMSSETAKIQMPSHIVEAFLEDLGPQVSADVLYHLSDHLDEAKALAAMEPRAAVLTVGKLSATLSQPKAEQAPRALPKTVSDAPAPGVTLGGRATVPADALEAARKSKDFRRFRAEFNARELAKKK